MKGVPPGQQVFPFLHFSRKPMEGGKRRRGDLGTHRGVDTVISFHVGVLSGSVVGFSERDAWHAAGDCASVDGRKAPEQGLVPWSSIRGSIGSDDGRVGESLVEAFDPVVHIVLVDDRLLGCSWSGLSHCERVRT